MRENGALAEAFNLLGYREYAQQNLFNLKIHGSRVGREAHEAYGVGGYHKRV